MPGRGEETIRGFWFVVDCDLPIMVGMKTCACLLPVLLAMPAAAQTMAMNSVTPAKNERLGTVVFPVSCAGGTQAGFNRGVALVHDFWYDEARTQFDALVKSDPGCAMAHWGVAMSGFHQIWTRPSAATMKLGAEEMAKAQALVVKAGTEREREYIDALAAFYKPGSAGYPERIAAYSAAMGRVYEKNPGDVDAGAFYALSLLAAKSPDDTGLGQERKAMAVLGPLFVKDPDDPGVDHYITHACDNPAMAAEGLAGANHYLEIAQDGPHAYHMPGHIYARLGLWPQDIVAQLGSIAASQRAETAGESGVGDEPHSYDFLLYAYLQSGQDAKAKAALEASAEPLKGIAEKPMMGSRDMGWMIPYYETKLPAFYALEMRDWKTAAVTEPVKGSPEDVSMLVYWTRAIADGHLKLAKRADGDLARYDELLAQVKRGPRAYTVEGTRPQIQRDEMVAWAAYAAGKQDEALVAMRSAAELQDKVGQGEVDIPAREMLADMLLEFGKPKEALAEYEVALRLSPNRLNGLYGAGRAAEAAGEKQKAGMYYAELLKLTDGGRESGREQIAHAKGFVGAGQVAAR
jgi:tetratricopeptide (TPR) repeat protein